MASFVQHGILAIIFGAATFCACSLIDENRDDCDNYAIDYELKLITNLTTELETQLSLETDMEIAAVLRQRLSSIFTDYAKDVDLSFYDVQDDSLRLEHMVRPMEANQRSYTLSIPIRQYHHLAVANLSESGNVQIRGDERCHVSTLTYTETSDTVNSHSIGVFSARLPMHIEEGKDQEFNVRLFMVNCASAIVADTLGTGIRDFRVFGTGFASDFAICDSTYHFLHPVVVRSERVPLDTTQRICHILVNLPSPEMVTTKASVPGEGSWQLDAYVQNREGIWSHSRVGVSEPLRAGQFRLIKLKVDKDGSLAPSNSTVGVSVKTDWGIINHGDVPL